MIETCCRDCRHWTPPATYEWFPGEKFGTCELTKSEDGNPHTPKTAAFARDAEGYRAELATKPDFSCNQFEPKRD